MHLRNLIALMILGLIAFGAFVLAIYLVVGRPSQPESTTTVITQEPVTQQDTVTTPTTVTVPVTTNQGQTARTSTTEEEGTGPPSASCSSSSGSVLYEADWSSGMDGWAGSSDWKHVDSMLVSGGSPSSPNKQRILAPCQPPTQDYAIEAKIQLLDSCGFGSGAKEFGLLARATEQGGILGGVDCDKAKIASAQNGNFDFDHDPITSEPFTPGGEWHVYRLEVEGNNIRLFVDGAPLLETADNRNLDGSKVGLFNVTAQVNVASFEITKL